MHARAVFVTGVSGSGKSTVGSLLAERLGWGFVDADDLHPKANVEKMAAGVPLTDDDRWPWLAAVGQAADRTASGPAGGTVVACSALRKVYRDLLAEECPGAFFVQLAGDAELLTLRMQARADHFMPPALLGSQLSLLEPLAPTERGTAVAVTAGPDAVVDAIVTALEAAPA